MENQVTNDKINTEKTIDTITNIDLSNIPLEILLAEIEVRKDDETRKIVSTINNCIRNLHNLNFKIYNGSDSLYELGYLNIVTSNSDKISYIEYQEINTEND